MTHFPLPKSSAPNNGGLSRAFVLFLVSALFLLLVQPVFANPPEPTPGPTSAMLDKIYKSASQATLFPGETVTYVIHLETGWGTGVQARVSDPLPTGLEYVADSADHGGMYDTVTRTITWTGIKVIPGTPVDLKFAMQYNLPVPKPTPTVNIATISWNGFLLQRMAWVTLLPAAPGGSVLRASFKTASQRMLGAGEKVTYGIHLLNNGDTPVSAAVSDPLPAILSFVAGSANTGGVYDPLTQTVTCKDVLVPPYNPLLPVEPITLTFEASAPEVLPMSIRPLLVTNTAAITADQETIQRSVDILLVGRPISPLAGSFKTASQREVSPGEVFSYSIQLHNSSSNPVYAEVIDPIPVQVSYVAGSANADGVYDETTRTLTWRNLTIPEGTTLELTFDVKAQAATASSLRITNTALISSGGITLKRGVTVLLTPRPGADVRPPVVKSLTIDEKDVLTQPEVTLHISAVDNVAVTKMFLKEWVLATDPLPHWQEVQSSGWITFQADLPWKLSAQSGTHFIGVWVADAARNKSKLTRNALDFASLVLPGAVVAQGGLIPYLVYYPASVDVSATLTTLNGLARLFAWFPGNLFAPNQAVPTPSNRMQTIRFTTRMAGIYLFLVYGIQPATYDLSITPGGGPRLPANSIAWPSAADSFPTIVIDPDTLQEGLTANPILPYSGLDPLGAALEPDGPFYQVFLPSLHR